MEQTEQHYAYAGFWVRVVATLIDVLIISIVLFPLVYGLMLMGVISDDWASPYNGNDFLWDTLSSLAQGIFTVFCWLKFAGTPGKRLLKLKVLDEKTGNPLTLGQAVLRYIAYLPAIFVLFLGLIWVAFDGKKQGWHDKIAKTVVVKELT